MFHKYFAALALAGASLAAPALAAVTPPAGYIYSTQLLSSTAQSCVAAAPGGTFVGIGAFGANAQGVVLAKPSGDLRLVVWGLNSIGDCAYDAATDTLYVSDNGGEAAAALTGDTVFAVPAASTASGLAASAVELQPEDSIPLASSLAILPGGNLLVTNAAGGGLGSVLEIAGMSVTTFTSPFDLTGGIAVNPSGGNVFVAELLDNFVDNQISQFTGAGVAVPPVPFAGPSGAFGSYDLAFNADGRLLVTGVFAGNVVSFNPADATSVPFIGGLNFATSITVEPFTQRVDVLSAAGGTEGKSVHRFTPIDQLAPGKGSPSSECLQEAYGLQLVDDAGDCTDGAACDADGVANDACVFPVGVCLNVDDPDFTACSTASNVTEVTVAATPASAALAAAAAQIDAALPLTGSSCFFSDGYWVPVKITGSGDKKDGKGKLKVTTVAADGRKDTDTYRLVCHPAP